MTLTGLSANPLMVLLADSETAHPDANAAPSFIGVLLATVGSTFIGISYTASKNAHNKVKKDLTVARQRAPFAEKTPLLTTASPSAVPEPSPRSPPVHGDGEHHDYSIVMAMKHVDWWISMVLLLAGEICQFLAYGYAPTSVIAPLGTLSIISGALSGYFYLGERIRAWNLLGMLVSIIGAIMIVLFSRSEEPQLSPGDIVQALMQVQFVIYAGTCLLLASVLWMLDSTRIHPHRRATYGDRWMGIRVSLTAIFSGFTVLATKSISSLLTLSWYHIFASWLFYVMLLALIGNAVLTLYFTNKALARFDSTSVLPAEFAAFTCNVVLGSAMLYNDFASASVLEIVMFVLGCLTTFIGVYFITFDGRVGAAHGLVEPDPRVSRILAGAIPPLVLDDHHHQPRDRLSALEDNVFQVIVEECSDRGEQESLREEVSYYADGTDGMHQEQEEDEVNLRPPRRALQRLGSQLSTGLLTVANALGSNRASISFQHVVAKNHADHEQHEHEEKDEEEYEQRSVDVK